VIVSESWPSWFPISGSVNFVCASIYSNDTTSRKLLSPLLNTTQWFPEGRFQPSSYPLNTWFLISGCLEWITALRSRHLGLLGRSLLTVPFNGGIPCRTSSVTWIKELHSHVGGVTSGAWFLGVDIAELRSPWLLLSGCYGRQLQHIIQPSSPIRGQLISRPPPGDATNFITCPDDRTSLHPHGLLPVEGAVHVQIRCGSVFSATKWVSRSLTCRELGDAFDLPQAYLSLFDDTPNTRLHTLPFLRVAPPKLLRAFVVAVLTLLSTDITAFYPEAAALPSALLVDALAPPCPIVLLKAQQLIFTFLRCRWYMRRCNIFLWWFASTYGFGDLSSPLVVWNSTLHRYAWAEDGMFQYTRWRIDSFGGASARDDWAAGASALGSHSELLWESYSSGAVAGIRPMHDGQSMGLASTPRGCGVLVKPLSRPGSFGVPALRVVSGGEYRPEGGTTNVTSQPTGNVGGNRDILNVGVDSRLDPYFAKFLLGASDDIQVAAREKAAKHDNAAVPTFLWNDNLWEAYRNHPAVYTAASLYSFRTSKDPLDVLRVSFFLPLWKRSVVRSWRKYYLCQTYSDAGSDRDKDRSAAADCFRYVSKASWWEWDGGSRLFFWRWPVHVRQAARDGFKSFIKGPLPHYHVPQREEKDEAIKEKVIPKLVKVVDNGYMIPCKVKSLTSYFWVKKGDDDIRLVYDGTKSGLNGALWAPSFGLPNVETLLSAVEETTWMADIDVGDMFLNFQLDEELQAYCGVDLKPYLPALKSWMAWARCAMGLLPSPYFCVKFLLLAAEIFRGDKTNPSNPFRFDFIRMNLPGSVLYDPSKPWVSKIKQSTGKIAADVVQYVDDLRPTGESKLECTRATRAVSAGLGYLGIQDASRKRVEASQNSGAWTGSVVVANDLIGVGVRVTLEKWNKTKSILSDVKEEYALSDGNRMNHKRLQRVRGYLMYVTTTYPSMVPYMKGFHLTLDGWRPNRDDDGWKFTLAEIRRQMDGLDWVDDEEDEEADCLPPIEVKASNRLLDDVNTLIEMTSGADPPIRIVRSKVIAVACYGFGDASGSGFGSSIAGPHGLLFRHGLWGSDGNGKSSNYRELCNLVETVEEGLGDKSLEGCELFIFTDNTVAEAAFYKGNTSSSRLLFNLIVRLRKIEMIGNIRLWVIHVAGKRMIAQGTDALSRGNMIEGVMSGVSMLEFVPLSQSAFDRTSMLKKKPSLLSWFRQWVGEEKLNPLTPLEWFNRGHGFIHGQLNDDNVWLPVECNEYCFIWAPPPAAGRIAIEQMTMSRHKRTDRLHVFVCPRLFTSEWRKRLYKVADCVLEIPAGARSFWPVEMFEPLIIGIVLPFLSNPPWQLKRSEEVLALEGRLRQVFKDERGDEGSVLRELLGLSPRKASM